LGTAEQAEVKERSGGLSLAEMANRLLAINPDLRARLRQG